MSTPFIGELRVVAFNFAPPGWAFCNGQLIPIDQFSALFNLIGTTFGGDGETTFGLPDLRGRSPVHVGNAYSLGELGGAESVVVTSSTMPGHTHAAHVARGPDLVSSGDPTGRVWGSTAELDYTVGGATTTLAADALGLAGGSVGHENRPPFLALNVIIALLGIFPSQG